MPDDEFRASRAQFEPAITHNELQFEMGTTDWEGDLKATRAGLEMGESRGVPKRHRRQAADDLRAPDLNHEDVGGLLRVMTAKNPGQHLFHVTDEGKFRLGATEVRDALESVITPVEPVREERGLELADGVAESKPDDELTPAELEAEAEQVVVIRQFLEARRDRAQPGTVEHVVLVNWDRLVTGEASRRQLAKETGLSRQSLDRAYDAVAESIRREIERSSA
jgi:hypothetical protein